jgi:hypothetical protein
MSSACRESRRGDDRDTPDPVGRVERMIEHYRLARLSRLKRRAMTLWRKTEAREAVAAFEKPPLRVH